MKRKRIIFTCGICAAAFGLALSLSVNCPGQGEAPSTPGELFAKGNEFYVSGDHASAIGEYEKILALDQESGPLYYNLANAYFKAGALGKAILNYQRAKDLMPRDADLLANYRYARAMVQGKEVPCRGIWNWAPLRIYCAGVSIDEMTLISSGMYLVIIVLLFIGVLRPGWRRLFVPVIIALAVAISLNVIVIWHKTREIRTAAVTIKPDTEALYAPYGSATKFFTLPEGMKVNVLKDKDQWRRVRRSDGNVGWVPRESLEMVR